MQKLSFLIGSWSGEAHVQRSPGNLATLVQTENVTEDGNFQTTIRGRYLNATGMTPARAQ